MSSLGENILQVLSLLIHQALDYPHLDNYAPFYDETFLPAYHNLLEEDKNKVCSYIMPPNVVPPSESTHFHIACFAESARYVL